MKFKTLGSILAAVCALGALSASPAAAEFHAAAVPTTLHGTQTTAHVFKTTSGGVTCKSKTFSGTMTSKTTSTITLVPSELTSGCTAYGFIGVPIHFNGCAYILHANGTTVIECPGTAEIEITVPGCTTFIGPQHIATGNTFSNNAGKTDINITTHMSGITYRECSHTATLQHDGTYDGNTTLTGSSSIWYE